MRLIVLVLLSGFVSAQTQYGERIIIGEERISFDTLKEEVYAYTVGTPYYNDEFVSSEVIGLNHKMNLRYNAYTDDMEFMLDDELYALRKEVFHEVLLGPSKSKYVFTVYKQGKKYTNGFLRVIFESEKVVFYKKERVIHKDTEISSSGYDVTKPPVYKKIKPLYFVKFGDDTVEIPKKSKRMAKLFGTYELEVREFIKSEKLDLKNESDILRLAEFVEML